MQATFEKDGLRLNYYVDDFTDSWSNPQVVLMLHSALGSSLRFNSWVPGLSRKYRVIRLDMRGHGESDIPSADSEFSLSVLADDVIALLDHLGEKRVHMVGNSGGGYVGQHLAMQFPERIATLALFASGPGAGTTQVASWVPKIKDKGLRHFVAETIADRLPPHLMKSPLSEAFIDALADNDIDFVCRLYAYMGSQNWTDQLSRIQCPTLVVVPGEGRIGSPASYRPMLEKIPQCEMLVYSGEYHHVCEYLPDRCVIDLLSFLERHRNAY